MPAPRLTPVSEESNRKALILLCNVMRRHNLTRAKVADLLGVSRVLVTRWFKHEKRCPPHAADTIRMHMTIRSKESVRLELITKRRERTERRKLTPSYPTPVVKE